MEKKEFRKINIIVAAVTFVLSSIVYLSTIEPTTSFWDCGEFIASSYKLEVGHPPGNPAFNLFARLFTMFTGPEHAAQAVNAMSALCAALTIFFLYLTIVHFGRRIFEIRGKRLSAAGAVALFGAGFVGAMACCFSDTFWFSAVEGEVYAMSSLFTAVAFWAVLKWEEEADRPYADRWIILICFLMGISIGVHLLNLLTIPAIVFIYYYRKHGGHVSLWKCFGILCLSGAILALILFGIIPYLPRLAASFDRLFVNRFHTGFNIGAAVFMILLFALCFLGLRLLRRKNRAVLHTCLLGFTTIVIGYSLFAITIIRSCAGTPTNEYQPDNPYTLIRYLGREQYGKTPIVFGQSFDSPYEVKELEYYTPLDGEYCKATNIDADYPSGTKTFFPRMWSNVSQSYIDYYKQYCNGFDERSAKIYGKLQRYQAPKFSDNLKFFFQYQVGYMYIRYFMWNFAGRQNDFHGQVPGDYVSGNWESGIKFIDDARLGDQSQGPDIFVNNRSKNHYFFLPLILGLIGFFFQLRRDPRNCWVTGLLFLLTGLAIVIYLNQTPFQVRERDYAYAGSFYVFTIWIGLGVLAVWEWLESLTKKSDSLPAAVSALVLCITVPALMGCENWDDHDRSGRYTARDLAYNYLQTTDPDAILVTHGDNDTFPLWYAQEVEGIRTDVRIVNTSLLGTDWYIDQMKHRFYESAPLPLSIERKQYLYGTNDFVPVIEAIDYPILASDAIDIFRNPKYVTTSGDDYLPARTLVIPVNKENVKKYGIVSEKYWDRIKDSISITISTDHLTKTDLILLDLLAHYDWSRPIYFVSRNETELGLEPWLESCGFCYKLIPVAAGEDEDYILDADLMYDKMMNVYRFDSLKDTTVHYDYQNIYTFSAVVPIREMFTDVADALIKEGRYGEALALADKVVEVMPSRNFPYNVSILRGYNEWSILSIIEIYLKLNCGDKAIAVAEEMADQTIRTIILHSTPVGPGEDDVISKKLSDDAATMYYYLIRLFKTYGSDEYAQKLQDKLAAY